MSDIRQVRLADRAVSALQELIGEGDYVDPPQMYDVLTRLTKLASLTAEALTKSGQQLQAESRAGQIGADDGTEPTEVIGALMTARDSARDLAAHLDTAAGRTGHLTRAGVHQA